MAFVHLQVHSEFSVLKSSARLDGILDAAAADNAPAVALTDHGAMFGILEIQTRGKDLNKARKEQGLPPIKTIYGCHIYVHTSSASQKDPSTFERLTLLVENEKGYYIVDVINEAIDTGRKIRFQYADYSTKKRKVVRRKDPNKVVRRKKKPVFTAKDIDLVEILLGSPALADCSDMATG